jgi:polysaccharide export outer membrane protein
MNHYLNLSKFFTKYFLIFIVAFSMMSCAQNEAVKSSPYLDSPAMTSADGTVVNSNPPEPVVKDVHPSDSAPITSTEDAVSDSNLTETLSEYANNINEQFHDEQDPQLNQDTNGAPAYGGNYIIGPEDLLEISVYQVSELNQTLRVSSRGFIKLPLAGKIKAAGLTVPELEKEIGKKYERYLQEPLVSVFIQDYRSQSITILGAVRQPQNYIVTRQKHLIDIISLAGGLTNDAGDICYIRRGSETIIINLNDLLIGGDVRLNVPVYSGDFVHVPIGGIIFVDGSVNSPGSFGMKGTVTLTQAIALSRGFKYEAIRDQVRVYRDTGKATREIIEVDYDAILANKSPDIILKDKDVVIVPMSGAKKLFGQFVQSLSGAFRIGTVSVGGGL